MSAPVRSAANETSVGAPEKVSLPPMTSSRPKSPLCAVGALGLATSNTSPGPTNLSIIAGKPICFTTSSPVCFLAWVSPVLDLWNVMVRSALTAVPKVSPVSESMPVGTSTATLKPLSLFICSTIWAIGGLSFPFVPVPKRASATMSASILGIVELSLTS